MAVPENFDLQQAQAQAQARKNVATVEINRRGTDASMTDHLGRCAGIILTPSVLPGQSLVNVGRRPDLDLLDRSGWGLYKFDLIVFTFVENLLVTH